MSSKTLKFIITVMFCFWLSESQAFTRSDVYLSSNTIPQGDLNLIKITSHKGETTRVFWLEKEIFLTPNENGKYLEGFIGIDLDMKPGHHNLVIKTSPSGKEEVFGIDIVDKDYGVRRLTLPDNMVNLSKEDLDRVTKETARLNKIWTAPPSDPIWNGSFMRPVDGEVVGTFGRRSIINDQPRSPHSGVDLRGAKGTPVKASNSGKVVLIANHFFTGNTVILDHGGNIHSMYFHLDKILVNNGDIVHKGDVIGLVGATGRVTGPHLHWGVRVNGARVNPLTLIDISDELEE